MLDLRVESGPGLGAPVHYLDIVATHPVSATDATTRANARTDGRQAASWEQRKQQRYSLDVVPLAVESYGRWGRAALNYFRRLARVVAAHDQAFAHHGRWATSALMARWLAVLSVGLQTGSANTLAEAFAAPRASWRPSDSAAPTAWELLAGGAGVTGAEL